MLSTPAGTPACSKICMTRAPVKAVRVAGLKTTVFPEISAGAIFQTGMEPGKFHGAIAATTPSGCFSVYAKFFGNSLGIVSPPKRRPSPAMNSRMLTDFCTSPSASFSALPSSRVISRATSSFCCSINSAAFASTRLRTGAGVSRHAGNASRAAATAARVSSRVESGAKPMISSRLAGLRRSDVLVAEDSTHRPPMKLRQVCDVETAVAIACSIPCGLVRGSGVLRRARTRDFAVRLRTSIAIELPGIADLLNFVEIQLGDKQLVFVAAGLCDEFAARIAEIALAVELADFPGLLGAYAIDGGDKVSVRYGMRGLLQFPQIFGKAGDGSRGIVDNLGAIESENARAFRKMAVVANVDAHARVARVKDRVTGVARREIKFLPEARMAVRDVVLAIFSEVAAVGVDHRGRIVVDAGHLHFINRDDEYHLVLLRELLHARDGRAVRHPLGQFVPSRLLLGAKVGSVEKFLEAEDLHLLLGGIRDEALVLGDHLFFNVAERQFLRRPFAVNLNQTAAHVTSHSDLHKRWRKVYSAAACVTRTATTLTQRGTYAWRRKT